MAGAIPRVRLATSRLFGTWGLSLGCATGGAHPLLIGHQLQWEANQTLTPTLITLFCHTSPPGFRVTWYLADASIENLLSVQQRSPPPSSIQLPIACAPSKESCNCPSKRRTPAQPGNLSKYFIHVTSTGSSKYSARSTKPRASDEEDNTNNILPRPICFAWVVASRGEEGGRTFWKKNSQSFPLRF